ncbi:MAG: hypothetical protein ACE5DM_01040 [Candidatus Nanoarchaeia archaeon]
MKMIKNWNYLMQSFKEKRLLQMLLYDGMMLLILFVVGLLFVSYLQHLAVKSEGLVPVGLDTQITTDAEAKNFASVVKIQIGYALATTFAVILLVLAYISTRYLLYSTALGKKKAWGMWGRYFLASVLLWPIVFVVSYLVQAALFMLFAPIVDQRLPQILLFVLLAVLISLLVYIIINFTLRYFREQSFLKGIKAFWKENIIGIGKYLLPILYAIIVFMIFNTALFFLLFIPNRAPFMIGFTIFLVLYACWVRTYYLVVMEGSVQKKHRQKRTATKKSQKRRTARKKR